MSLDFAVNVDSSRQVNARRKLKPLLRFFQQEILHKLNFRSRIPRELADIRLTHLLQFLLHVPRSRWHQKPHKHLFYSINISEFRTIQGEEPPSRFKAIQMAGKIAPWPEWIFNGKSHHYYYKCSLTAWEMCGSLVWVVCVMILGKTRHSPSSLKT